MNSIPSIKKASVFASSLFFMSFLILSSCNTVQPSENNNQSASISINSTNNSPIVHIPVPAGSINSGNFSSFPLSLNAYEYRIIFISNDNESIDTGNEWWKDAVMYQVYTRSFKDSGSDGIGDLQGLISKLDYITNIGFTGIWTMPLFKSPSVHGYDTTDYYSIKSDYGNSSDFDAYVSAAHARGLKIQLDLVVNHTSDQHPWFIGSVNKDGTHDNWYVWTNSSTDLTGWTSPWNDSGNSPDSVWYLNSTRGEKYYAAFWSGMPDLNWNEPAVVQEVSNIIEYWLGKGVDGYRLDAVRYFVEEGPAPLQKDTAGTKNALRKIRMAVKAFHPDANTVGETWTETLAETAAYYDGGKGLDLGFPFQFAYAIKGIFGNQNKSDMVNFINDINTNTAPLSFYATFMDNHDDPLGGDNRLMDVLGNNFAKLKSAFAIQMTFPGTPYVYYGTEIGMRKNTGLSGDAAKRTPMQWDNSAYAGFSTANPWESLSPHNDPYNVNTQLSDPDSALNEVKWLISIRKKYSALRRGQLKIIDNDQNSALSYMRPGTNGSILVVVNLSDQAQNVNLNFTGSGLSSSSVYPLADLTGHTNTTLTNSTTNAFTANYTEMYLRGVMNGWVTPGIAMSLVSNNLWETTLSVSIGEDIFKFVASPSDWSVNWGDNNMDGIADSDGNNITNNLSGTLTFRFNDQTLEYTNF